MSVATPTAPNDTIDRVDDQPPGKLIHWTRRPFVRGLCGARLRGAATDEPVSCPICLMLKGSRR